MLPDWTWFKDVSHNINVAPPHNLDLNSQKTLCGIVKEYVAASHYCTNKELHWAVLRAFTIITAQMSRGRHTGHGSAVDCISSMATNNQ
jgi:hypothetical protein